MGFDAFVVEGHGFVVGLGAGGGAGARSLVSGQGLGQRRRGAGDGDGPRVGRQLVLHDLLVGRVGHPDGDGVVAYRRPWTDLPAGRISASRRRRAFGTTPGA